MWLAHLISSANAQSLDFVSDSKDSYTMSPPQKEPTSFPSLQAFFLPVTIDSMFSLKTVAQLRVLP